MKRRLSQHWLQAVVDVIAYGLVLPLLGTAAVSLILWAVVPHLTEHDSEALAFGFCKRFYWHLVSAVAVAVVAKAWLTRPERKSLGRT